MKLIVTDTNWADEMHIWGYEVISDANVYLHMVQAIDLYFRYHDDIEIHVGSNEEITFRKEYMRHFNISDILEEDVNSLVRSFGSIAKGHNLFGRLVEYCLDYLDEDNPEEAKRLSDIIYE